MATITESNGNPPVSDEKKEEKGKSPFNEVKIFKFKEYPPPEFTEIINNPEIELGPMTSKILDDGTYMAVVYFRSWR